MFESDLIILMRNILLVTLAASMVPDHAVAVNQGWRRFLKSVHTPFWKKGIPKKRGSFFEIDFTKFEP